MYLLLLPVYVFAQKAILLQEVANPRFPLVATELPDRVLFQEPRTKKIIGEWSMPGRGLGGLIRFSPQGEWCLVSGNHGETAVFRISAGDVKLVTVLPFLSRFVAFNEHQEEVVLVYPKSLFSAFLVRYSTQTWKPVAARTIAADIHSLGVSYDGKRIAYANSRLLQFLDYSTLKKLEVNWEREKQGLLTFNPQKLEMASVTDRNSIQIRDFSDSVLMETKAAPAEIVWLGYDHSGKYMISTDAAGELFVWDITQNKPVDHMRQVYLPPAINSHNQLLFKQHGEWQAMNIGQSSTAMKTDTSYLYFNKSPRLKIRPQPMLAYTRETGLLLGARATMVWYPKANNSSRFSQPLVFVPSISYGANGNQLALGASMETYYGNTWHLVNQFAYTNHGRNYFFGVNEASKDSRKTSYTTGYIWLEGSLSKMVKEKYFLGLAYKFRKDNPPDFDVDPEDVGPGREGGWLLGLGPTFRMDKRNNVLFPSQGSWLEMNYYVFSQALVSDYQYQEFKLDYRKYFAVNWLIQGDVLAIQAMFNSTWGGNAPFYQLPYMTADRAFRGVWRNLYIADQVYSVQAEYRSYFSAVDHRFGYALFAGMGDGSSNFLKHYHASIKSFYGAGFRQQLIPKYRLDTRVDIGFTNKGDMGFFVGTGVSF